jgi:hypothetical protein
VDGVLLAALQVTLTVLGVVLVFERRLSRLESKVDMMWELLRASNPGGHQKGGEGL